jgi:hypothetical protein
MQNVVAPVLGYKKIRGCVARDGRGQIEAIAFGICGDGFRPRLPGREIGPLLKKKGSKISTQITRMKDTDYTKSNESQPLCRCMTGQQGGRFAQ